jgi:hypothetical protein
MAPMADRRQNPYAPLMTQMTRIDLELKLNNGRNWILETYTALGEQAMDTPATRDEHDADVWWTPRDHFAHANRLVSLNNRIIRSHFFGEQPPVMLDHGHVADTTPEGQGPEAMMAAVHRMTHEIWEENRSRSLSEIVAMGQRVRGEQLQILGELTDDQLDGPGPMGGTVADLVLLNLGHDRLHLRWAIDGLAERTRSVDTV